MVVRIKFEEVPSKEVNLWLCKLWLPVLTNNKHDQILCKFYMIHDESTTQIDNVTNPTHRKLGFTLIFTNIRHLLSNLNLVKKRGPPPLIQV